MARLEGIFVRALERISSLSRVARIEQSRRRMRLRAFYLMTDNCYMSVVVTHILGTSSRRG